MGLVLGNGLFISEIMADNAGTNAVDVDGDGIANKADEFVEIQNATGGPVSLDGLQLWSATGGLLYSFGATDTVSAGGTATIIGEYTGTPPADVYAATTNDGLNFLPDGEFNLNETVYLLDTNSGEYVAIAYGDPPNPALPAGFTGTTDLGTEQITTEVDNGTSIQRDAKGDLTEGTPTPDQAGESVNYTAPLQPNGVVDGTGGDDIIIANDSIFIGGYVDAQGEEVDNLDNGGSNQDVINAGQGNDSVSAGAEDDLVYGGGGNDTIDGGDGGDTIYGDTLGTPTQQSEFLDWTDQGVNGDDISGGFSQDTGSVIVTVDIVDDGGLNTAEVSIDPQYTVAGEPFENNSAIQIGGAGNGGAGVSDTTTINMDFQTKPDSGFGYGVENVQFRINDIDQSSWDDLITVTAIGPDGQPVTVSYQIDGDETLINGGGTIDGAGNDTQSAAGGSVLVTIAGPVQSVAIDYDNAGTGGQALWVTDVHFDTVIDDAPGDDVIDGGAGGDVIFGQEGNDDITGGTGNDYIVGGGDNDTIAGGGNDDIIYGDGESSVVTVQDFEGGATGWSDNTTDASNPNYGEILGRVEGTSSASDVELSTDIQLDSVHPHAVVEFDFHRIDSWDGEDFIIFIDGQPIDVRAFQGGSGDPSGTSMFSLNGTDYAITFTPTTGDVDAGFGTWNDQSFKVRIEMENAPGSFELGFGSTLDQGVNDESYAIDNLVVVSTNDTSIDVDAVVASPVTEGIDVIDGGDGNDMIFGQGGADTLDGGAGDDVLVGGEGDDSITGGDGNDSIDDGWGDDQASGNDNFDGGAGDDTIWSGIGNDTLVGGTGNDFLGGEEGDDTLYGGSGNDKLDGSQGNDSLFGQDGDDTLLGGSGDDYLDGDEGNDYIEGEEGSDVLVGDGGNDTLLGGADNDQIFASSGNNSVDGGTGADQVFMGTGDDLIAGGADADRLDGGAGDDIIYGGNGPDGAQTAATLDWSNVTLTSGDATTTVSDGTNSVDVTITGNGTINNTFFPEDSYRPGGSVTEANSTLLEFDEPVQDISFLVYGVEENLSVPYDDQITIIALDANGNQVPVTFSGLTHQTVNGNSIEGDGDAGDNIDNQITVNIAAPIVSLQIIHEPGPDAPASGGVGFGDLTFTVSEGFTDDEAADNMTGGDGDDTFYAGSFDTVAGGEDASGNDIDTLVVQDVDYIEYVNGDPEAGTVYFTDGTTMTFSEIENVTVVERDGTVSGTSGDDIIDNTYSGDPDGDVVDGNDQILAGAGTDDDLIEAGAGNDSITAGNGNDEIYGGADDDRIDGEAGNDTIDGGDGDDLIFAGAGDDTLIGGAGSDNFAIDQNDGNDTITGGESAGDADRLDFGPTTGGVGVTVTFDGDEQGDYDVAGGSATGDFTEIEAVIGSGFEDTLDGTLSDAALNLNGSDGDDTILGGGGDDQLTGGQGSDTFVISDDQGNDTIWGNEDAGGTDTDTLDFSGVTGATGVDITLSTQEDGDYDMLSGNGQGTFSGIEDFVLTDQDDIFDALLAPNGVSIDGAGGDDTFVGSNGDDTFVGGAGNDTLNANMGDDVLDGGDGDDVIFGDEGNDTIIAGSGNDLINGGADADLIFAGEGDIVDGGSGGNDDDTLDLTGSVATGGSYVINKVTDSDGNGFDGTVTYFDNLGVQTGTLTFENIENIVPCFTPGTLIATLRGQVRVENLTIGDKVLTRDHGFQPVEWAGRKSVDAATLAANPDLAPILIKAGALGNDLPERDMLVSPQHRMLVSSHAAEMWFGEAEVLVAAKHLTCLDGVEVAQQDDVTYIHFMCANHEVVLSDGAWSESFQPGDMSLAGLDDAARRELFTIFPELAQGVAAGQYQAARMTLKAHEVGLLF